MSRHVYKYGEMIGLVRHGDTSDIEIYNPEGKYVGRVVIEADSEDRREQIRDILRHWTPRSIREGIMIGKGQSDHLNSPSPDPVGVAAQERRSS